MKKTIMRVYFGEFVQAQWARIQAERDYLHNNFIEKNIFLDEVVIHLKKKEFNSNEMYCKDGVDIKLLNRNSILFLLFAMRKEISKNDIDIIHCHSWISTLMVCISMLFLRNKPLVVYEIHGATAFESWYKNSSSLKRFFIFPVFYFLENMAAILADKLFLVSFEIKKYYPCYYLKPSFVISRNLFKSQDNLNNHIVVKDSFLKFIENARCNNIPVVVYSGGFSKWQLPKETVCFINGLVEKKLAKGVIFTNQVDDFKEYMIKSDYWYIDSLNSNELPLYLKLCDAGMLLRENLILNRVASPTKLYEYINSGLVVITTKGAKEAKLACDKNNYFEIDLDGLLLNKVNLDNVFYDLSSVLKLNNNKSVLECDKSLDYYEIFSSMYDLN